jgi:hypothetical protein
MANYTFYPTVPATNNSPSSDQPNMQTNNQSINDWSAVDHVGYNVSNGGTHSQVTLLTPLGSDPSLTGTQGEIYTKSVSGAAQLFFANSAGANQLTSAVTTSGSLAMYTLPSGLKVCYTTATVNFTSGGALFTFPFAFTSSYVVLVTLEGATPTRTFSVVNNSLSQFTGYSSGSSNAVYFVAIGV